MSKQVRFSRPGDPFQTVPFDWPTLVIQVTAFMRSLDDSVRTPVPSWQVHDGRGWWLAKMRIS